MGRLDDIVARNQPRKGGGGGLIGTLVEASDDPMDTPEDRKRKQLAWVIVGGVLLAIVLAVAILS